MADLVLTVQNEQIVVQPFGADYLGGFVELTAAQAAQAAGSARAAQIAANLAQAYANQLPDFVQGSPGASATEVGLFAAAKGMTFGPGINRIRTTGRQLRGDGGAASYVRWVAPMAALTADQQNYSWFQAADGSQWVLEAGQTFYDAQFGALGDPSLTITTIAQQVAIGTDDAAAINAALNAPMVQTLVLTRQHWFGSDIRKPTGKHLIGIGRTVAGLHRIPLPVGATQAHPTFGVYCEDDDSGSFADFFVNCQRSGWEGLDPADTRQLNNRTSGIVIRRDSKHVRVARVDVYNSWGYSHYTCPGNGGNGDPTPRDIMRTDCRAFNGDTCFETTGLGIDETIIGCWGYRDPIDGGSLVSMEVAFHSYSGVAKVHRIRCGFRGSAPAVYDTVADGLDSQLIINEDCDWQTSGGQAAITVNNPDPQGQVTPALAGKKVLDYRIIRTSAQPGRVFDNGATPLAGLFSWCNVTIDDGDFGGIGIQVADAANVVLKNGPVITAQRSDGLFVTALNAEGTSRVDWYGKAGLISAVNTSNPTLAKAISDSGVTLHDLPTLIPAPASEPGNPIFVQRLFGHATAADMTNAGYTVPPNYWFTLTLPQPVASRDATQFSFSLQRDDNNTTGPAWSPSVRWLSDGQVQVYVNAPGGLDGCTLRYVVTEWTA